MIGLCIAEPYYRPGLCRLEYFETMEHLNWYRAKLSPRVTTWVLGKERPKAREGGEWF